MLDILHDGEFKINIKDHTGNLDINIYLHNITKIICNNTFNVHNLYIYLKNCSINKRLLNDITYIESSYFDVYLNNGKLYNLNGTALDYKRTYLPSWYYINDINYNKTEFDKAIRKIKLKNII